ncbi:hypothetical protein [Streptomyces monashensis]|uniref:Secreted protein n=1 Tax=Streptomyces monashensis TaxID=1678012 RepID=A0A1S2P839_9ACTN|nr:hypothetical protein [Streptomyces monashensis]OIJ89858.1 hypothetical protein BIV23_41425 [Streptomyces monashensis]
MKKRSILALATLATGFVVAAVTPSHAADNGPLDELGMQDTAHSTGDLFSQDGLAPSGRQSGAQAFDHAFERVLPQESAQDMGQGLGQN